MTCDAWISMSLVVLLHLLMAHGRNGCGKHESHFETSSKNELYNISDISMSVQVAFIVAGCTHTTYITAGTGY